MYMQGTSQACAGACLYTFFVLQVTQSGYLPSHGEWQSVDTKFESLQYIELLSNLHFDTPDTLDGYEANLFID